MIFWTGRRPAGLYAEAVPAESDNQKTGKGDVLRIHSRMAGTAAILAAAGFSTPATAQSPVYMGGGAAVQSVTGHDDGIAAVLRMGAHLDAAGTGTGFGVEGELTRSLIDPERGGNGRDVTITTFGGYATYTVPLPNQRVSLRTRLGLLWEELDPEGPGDDTDMQISWGLGGQYRVSGGLSAFVDYTRIESDVGNLAGGVLVSF